MSTELETLQKNWKTLISDMSYKDARSDAFLFLRASKSKVVDVKNNIITIGCTHKIAIDRLLLPENGLVIKNLIENHLGHAVAIRFVEGDFRTLEEKEAEEKELEELHKRAEEERAAKDAEEKAKLRNQLVKDWRIKCGIPKRFACSTFENFDTKLHKRAYDIVREYATAFYTVEDKPSLLMYSRKTPGLGKSHLASAVGHYVIENWNGVPTYGGVCPVLFVQENELLMRIRSTYNQGNYGQHQEREIDIYNQLRRVDLLIIDDIGKEQPADLRFCQRMYFDIINGRYNDMKPVVLTANLDTGELADYMGDAVVDRLAEMCGKKRIVQFTGESYRTRER